MTLNTAGMLQSTIQFISLQAKMKIKIENKTYELIEVDTNGIWANDEDYAECFIPFHKLPSSSFYQCGLLES
jgi:hypothetical protein